MKIEYFDTGANGLPVVLIYGNEPNSIMILRDAIRDLIQGKVERLAVHELPEFESIDNCHLYFSIGNTNRGVFLLKPPKTFECSIRPTWWDNVNGLLEPFCEPIISGAFQNLDYGFESNISIIISTDRGF